MILQADKELIVTWRNDKYKNPEWFDIPKTKYCDTFDSLPLNPNDAM